MFMSPLESIGDIFLLRTTCLSSGTNTVSKGLEILKNYIRWKTLASLVFIAYQSCLSFKFKI